MKSSSRKTAKGIPKDLSKLFLKAGMKPFYPKQSKASIKKIVDMVSKPYAKPAREPHPKKHIEAILKNHLAPFFKAEGFRKKAATFWRSDGDFIEIASMQRSQFNDAWQGRFCFNLGVYWNPLQKFLKRTSNVVPPRYSECFFNQRLKKNIQHGGHWWRLDSDTNPVVLGKEVVSDFQHYGLTWFARCHDPKTQPNALHPRDKLRKATLKEFSKSRKKKL
jgi:uncharacterized protein (DUF4415 family)